MSKDDSTGKIQWDRLLKKLSPYTVQKGLRYLKHYGLKEFWIVFTRDSNQRKFHTDRGMKRISQQRKLWRNSVGGNLRTVRLSAL